MLTRDLSDDRDLVRTGPAETPISSKSGVVGSGTPSERKILALQRQAGNRAIGRVLASSGAGVGLQREPLSTVGAVQEGYQLQDLEGGAGGKPGASKKAGQAGYSRVMQGAAGEMVEGMADEGGLSGLMLRHVSPDLSGLPAAKQRWLNRETRAKKEIDSWDLWVLSFKPPGSVVKHWENERDQSKQQVEVIEKCGAELQQRSNQFNSFVPQGNGFFVSAARLSAMQTMVGATDNASLAAALAMGLQDAEDVMKRYTEKYEGGDRKLTTEKLDAPEGGESVELAATEMKDASRELDEAYMGFQTTVLSGKIGEIKQEYAGDEKRLAEIEEVKKFVRNVGKTVDVTMSVVRGAPTVAANVTNTAKKAKASVNAVRNRRDILAGNRPRFNPTYVTADASGNMVVRNMQTKVDSNLMTGEKLPSPAEEGISLPKSVSDVLGTITDFAYHFEVERINLRLGQMRSRIDAVKAVIDATLFEQKILAYQNALNCVRHEGRGSPSGHRGPAQGVSGVRDAARPLRPGRPPDPRRRPRSRPRCRAVCPGDDARCRGAGDARRRSTVARLGAGRPAWLVGDGPPAALQRPDRR